MLRKCITFIGTLDNTYYMKSDNLQYNTLGRWDERLIDQASDVLSTGSPLLTRFSNNTVF